MSDDPVSPLKLATRATKHQTTVQNYHHGSLPQALLTSAETVLRRDGLAGLSLRAIAREAGVSHTAPKHHFGDTKGVLSELAALGYTRLVISMSEHADAALNKKARRKAIGRGYIAFATQHPDLFRLMGRNELLDSQRPSLVDSRRAALRGLADVFDFDVPHGGKGGRPMDMLSTMTATQLITMTAGWARVHGLASLLIDGRLNGLLAASPEIDSLEALVDAIFEQY